MLIAWAEREGWEVTADYQDAGVSATSDKRPAFQEMITAAEARLFDAVLTLRRDRFARNALQARTYRERLRTYGVQLLYHDEPNMEDSPAGFLINHNFEGYAEYFSRELGMKITRGKRARAAKGLSNGRPPFGYNADWTVNEAEADTARKMFDLYIGGEGFLSLSVWMRGRGRALIPSGLTKLFANPVLYGELPDGTPSQHPAIIERDVWMRAAEVRRERSTRPRAYAAHRAYPYLLSGVGRDAACGAPIWGHPQSARYRYYVCAQRGLQRGCRSRMQRVENLDNAMSVYMETLQLPEDWRQQLSEMLDQPEVDGESERRRLEQKVARAQRALLEGLVDEADAAAVIRDARSELARLAAPAVFERAAQEVIDLGALWRQKMTDYDRQAMIRQVVESVDVDMHTGTIVKVVPKGVFAVLFSAVGVSTT